jgi:hypothetical protein
MTTVPPLPDANVRSTAYFAARADVHCRHCGLSSQAVALAVPPEHETLEMAADAGDSDSDSWQGAHGHAFLFFVEALSESAMGQLNRLSPGYRLGDSPSAPNSYLMNHCRHCGTSLDDFELHCEPEGAFMPADEEAAAKIELLRISERLEATAAGYSLEPEFLRFMRRS